MFNRKTISDEGLDFIKSFEGFKSEPYICPAGMCTIGYGTTRYFDNLNKVTLEDEPISEEEATRLLRGSLEVSFTPLANTLIKIPINQNQFDAVVSFIYNAGATYLDKKTGHNKFYKLFEHINNKMPEAELRSYWENLAVTGGGKKLKGLIRRRKAESDLFFKK